jgi:hypothetical protein
VGAECVYEGGRELDAETFVTTAVLVRAHIFVTGIASQDRTGHQVKRPPSGVIAEAALSHIS